MGEEKRLQIYFTSDVHGYIYPTDYRNPGEQDIGLIKCANRFEKDGNTLIIDGGDLLQGSPLDAFQHDSVGSAEPLAEIMNVCGYDYVTLGNHDFNFGMAYLDSYLHRLQAHCLCQNILCEDGTVRFPWRIHTLENGLRVGMVGIVTDHVNLWERPENLTGYRIVDPLEAARHALCGMRDKVDLTICIYHGGFERDLASGRVLSTSTENIACKICEELDFDILLTGHQHMSVPGQKYQNTFIVQPTDSGREFIHMTAVVRHGEKVITSETIPAGGVCPPRMLERFKSLERGAQEWLDAVVGHMDAPLQPESPLEMAVKGSGLADFFNQVQMAMTNAQISVASLANEVAGLPQVVRRRDVLTAYPYTNTLAVLEVSGFYLRQALERSAEYFDLDEAGKPVISDRFLRPKVEHYNYDYYAGIDYTFDLRRPVGQRVTQLTYEGRAVQDEDSFTLCLNSYRASGAGGYTAYMHCPVRESMSEEMSDLILTFFRENPSVEVQKKGTMTLLY